MDSNRRSRYVNRTRREQENFIDLGLDLHSLEVFCKMIVSSNGSIRRNHLLNIGKLLNIISPEKYVNDPEKNKRINFIRKGIEARLGFNLVDPYMIMQHIDGGVISDDIIDLERYQDLNNSEIDFMNNMVSETLQYSTVYKSTDRMMDVCTRFKTGEYGSKGAIVEEFKNVINEVQNEFRRSRNEDHTEMMFSLREGQFEDCVIETYNRAKNPRNKLITGMQGLNELLGGGLECGRIYTFFGLPGEGKSTTILNIIYQLKKYNRDYICRDITKRPCIVLLTMENSVEESIERLFGMATDRDSMIEFDVETAIKLLRENGELVLTHDNPIDIIIKYKPTKSVDTSYVYTLTDDLEDMGYEVIAFFQDYIGRIRSLENYSDTRLEYGAVIDEFKTFAQFKDIPFVTVSQLNRDASKRIDEGRHASKSDLVRALGRSNISESMLILNNTDGGFMITPEYTSNGDKYLGVQRVKLRYKASNLECIYLPYSRGNDVKLVEDFGMEPSFKTSLRNNAGIPVNNTPYQQNEIKDIETIRSSTENRSIFSATVTSSNNGIEGLEVGFTPNEYAEPKHMQRVGSIDPMIFD